MDTLISGATIVTMNESLEVILGGFVGVTDGKIAYIGKEPPKEQPQTILDGSGMVLLPGLVNCHTQLAQTLLRNYLDDLPPREALEKLLALEAKMDSRMAEAAAKLGLAECLRMGITSVSDLYYYPEATAKALAASGMKGSLALSCYRFEDASGDFDFDADPQCREFVRLAETWHGFDGGRIRIDAGIYAEYTSNHPLWEGLSRYAVQKGLGFQLRLSQTQGEVAECLEHTGLTPAELLSCHGVFDVPAAAAGCARLTAQEQAILGKRGATAVSTPWADAMAGEPPLDVPGCLKAGMNVALGTGGAAQAGSLDLFEAMRLTAARSRGSDTPLPAGAVLMMATVCGARAQGRARECGMVKVGMDADLILLDFTAPHLMPCHNVLNGIVYSARGTDVAMTMVRGRILYQNGRFLTLDLAEAVEELTGYAIPKLFSAAQ